MRLLIKILGGLVVLFALVLVGLQFYVAGGSYKGELEKQASNALGRAVTIASVDSAGIFPNPGFEVSDLTIANADGMTDTYFASVGSAKIGVKLFPLFTGKAVIEKFVLDEPEIYLEKQKDGSVNWMLGATDGSTSPQSAETSGEGGGSVTGPLNDIGFGDVKLNNGKVTYRDRASDQLFIAEKTNLALTLTSLNEPLTAKGDMVFQGAPATLDATLTTPRALMENTASSIALQFSVEENSVDTKINLSGGDLAYDGQLDIDAPSLKSLLATLGMPLDVENGFNKLKISGDVSGTATRMSFTDAAITFDEISNATDGETDLVFDWGGSRPKVSGTVDLNTLDLRPYLPEPSEAVQATKKDKNAAFPPWPTDPIDFSALKAVDVDLNATTKGILLHGMTFGSSGLDFNIDNGVLVAQLTELNLYDGGGSGILRVNARGNTPLVELKDIRLTGMNAQRFATEVLGLTRLRGIGGLEANLTARGNSVADFMNTLTGSGSFDVNEGALEGIDIGKIIRTANTLISGFEGGDWRSFDVTTLSAAVQEARGPSSETQFTELDSSFVARNGVVTAQNVLLQGPFFQIEGNGSVNLPGQSMQMEFLPTVFDTLEATTGRKLNIPLQISGTFNSPKVGFNTEGLLRGAVEDRLKGLLGQQGVQFDDNLSLEESLKEKARDELKNRLLGTPPAGEDKKEGDEEASLEDELANRALNALFGAKKE